MEPTPSYAGFGARFVAALIDGILLGVVNFVIMTPLLGKTISLAMQADDGVVSEFDLMVWITTFLISNIAIMLAAWLYYAIMESSAYQATLGKKLMGIKVTDLQGARIGFGRATGRYFGKILSALIFMVGYLMAAFSEKKQALHDMISGCLVVKG